MTEYPAESDFFDRPESSRPTDLDPMGDDVYQPDGSEIVEDAGPLDEDDTLDNRGVGDPLDEGYSPPERPLAVETTGTTADEQRYGDSLDVRLRREEPDEQPIEGDGLGDKTDSDGELIDDEVGDRRSGRLVAPDEGAHARHDGVTGDDVGIDGGAASAEEAAVNVVADAEEVADLAAPEGYERPAPGSIPGSDQGSAESGEPGEESGTSDADRRSR